jgi:hypothetical protein
MTNGIIYPWTFLEDSFNATPIRLWRNNADGSFTEMATATGLTDTRSGKGLLVFDYDGDGDLDLFIVNNADTPVLYRNDGGNAKDWLRVRVVGCESNRDGLGARIRVRATPGSPFQFREVGAGTHYLGQSEPTAHFGLGTGSGPVAEVRVTWPKSGVQQVFRNVPRNTTLTVDECAVINAATDWTAYE